MFDIINVEVKTVLSRNTNIIICIPGGDFCSLKCKLWISSGEIVL